MRIRLVEAERSSTGTVLSSSSSLDRKFIDIENAALLTFRRIIEQIYEKILHRAVPSGFRNDADLTLPYDGLGDDQRVLFCHVRPQAGGSRFAKVGLPVDLDATPASLGESFIPPVICMLKRAVVEHLEKHVEETPTSSHRQAEGEQQASSNNATFTSGDSHRETMAATSTFGDHVGSGGDDDDGDETDITSSSPRVMSLQLIGCDVIPGGDGETIVALTVPQCLTFRQVFASLLVHSGRPAEEDIALYDFISSGGIAVTDVDGTTVGSLVLSNSGKVDPAKRSIVVYVTLRGAARGNSGRRRTSSVSGRKSLVAPSVVESVGSEASGQLRGREASLRRAQSSVQIVDADSRVPAPGSAEAENSPGLQIKSKASFRDRARVSTVLDVTEPLPPTAPERGFGQPTLNDIYLEGLPSANGSNRRAPDDSLLSHFAAATSATSSPPSNRAQEVSRSLATSQLFEIYGCSQATIQNVNQRVAIARNMKRAQERGLGAELCRLAQNSIASSSTDDGCSSATTDLGAGASLSATLQERRGLLNVLKVLLPTYRNFFMREHRVGWDATVLAETIMTLGSGFRYFASIVCAMQSWAMFGMQERLQLSYTKEPSRRFVIVANEHVGREDFSRTQISLREDKRRQTMCRVHVLILEEVTREALACEELEELEEMERLAIESDVSDLTLKPLGIIELVAREDTARRVFLDDEAEAMLMADAVFETQLLNLIHEHFSSNILAPLFMDEEHLRGTVIHAEGSHRISMFITRDEIYWRHLLFAEYLAEDASLHLQLAFSRTVICDLFDGPVAVRGTQQLFSAHRDLMSSVQQTSRSDIEREWRAIASKKFEEFCYARQAEQETRFSMQRADLELKEKVARSRLAEQSDLQNQLWFNVMADTNANLWGLHNQRTNIIGKEHRKRHDWIQIEDYQWRVMMGHLELDVLMANNRRRIERDQAQFHQRMLQCEQEVQHRMALYDAYCGFLDHTRSAGWFISCTNERFRLFSFYQRQRQNLVEREGDLRVFLANSFALQASSIFGCRQIRYQEEADRYLIQLRFEQKRNRYSIETEEETSVKTLLLDEYSDKVTTQRKQAIREARDDQLAILELFTTLRFVGGPIPRTLRISVECPKDMPVSQILEKFVFPQLRASRPHLSSKDILTLYDLVESCDGLDAKKAAGHEKAAVIDLDGTPRSQLNSAVGAIIQFVPKQKMQPTHDSNATATSADPTVDKSVQEAPGPELPNEKTASRMQQKTEQVAEEDLLPMPQLPPIPRRVRSVVAHSPIYYPVGHTSIETDEVPAATANNVKNGDDGSDDDERIVASHRRRHSSFTQGHSSDVAVGAVDTAEEAQRQQDVPLPVDAAVGREEQFWNVHVAVIRAPPIGASRRVPPGRLTLRVRPSWTVQSVLDMVVSVRPEFEDMLAVSASTVVTISLDSAPPNSGAGKTATNGGTIRIVDLSSSIFQSCSALSGVKSDVHLQWREEPKPMPRRQENQQQGPPAPSSASLNRQPHPTRADIRLEQSANSAVAPRPASPPIEISAPAVSINSSQQSGTVVAASAPPPSSTVEQVDVVPSPSQVTEDRNIPDRQPPPIENGENNSAASKPSLWGRLKSLLIPASSTSSTSILTLPVTSSEALKVAGEQPCESVVNIRIAGGPVPKERKLIVSVPQNGTIRDVVVAASTALGCIIPFADYECFPVRRSTDPLKPAVPDTQSISYSDLVASLNLPAVILKLTPEAKLREAAARVALIQQQQQQQQQLLVTADMSYRSTEWEVDDEWTTSADEQAVHDGRHLLGRPVAGNDDAVQYLPSVYQIHGNSQQQQQQSLHSLLMNQAEEVHDNSQREKQPHGGAGRDEYSNELMRAPSLRDLLLGSSYIHSITVRVIGHMIPKDARLAMTLSTQTKVEDLYPAIQHQLEAFWKEHYGSASTSVPTISVERHELATMELQPDGVASLGTVFEPFDTFESRDQSHVKVLLIRNRQKKVEMRRGSSLSSSLSPPPPELFGTADSEFIRSTPSPANHEQQEGHRGVATYDGQTFRVRIVGAPIPRTFVLVVEHVLPNRILGELLSDIRSKLSNSLPSSVLSTIIPGIYQLTLIPSSQTLGLDFYGMSGIPIDTITSLLTSPHTKPLDLNASAWVNSIEPSGTCWMALSRVGAYRPQQQKIEQQIRRENDVHSPHFPSAVPVASATDTLAQPPKRGGSIGRDIRQVVASASADDDDLMNRALAFDCIQGASSPPPPPPTDAARTDANALTLVTGENKFPVATLPSARRSHANDGPSRKTSIPAAPVASDSDEDFDYGAAAATLGLRTAVPQLTPRTEFAMKERQKPPLPSLTDMTFKRELDHIVRTLPSEQQLLRNETECVSVSTKSAKWSLGASVDLGAGFSLPISVAASEKGVARPPLRAVEDQPIDLAGLELDEEDPVILVPPQVLSRGPSHVSSSSPTQLTRRSSFDAQQQNKWPLRSPPSVQRWHDDDGENDAQDDFPSPSSLDMRQSSTHHLHSANSSRHNFDASIRQIHGASDAEHFAALLADPSRANRVGTRVDVMTSPERTPAKLQQQQDGPFSDGPRNPSTKIGPDGVRRTVLSPLFRQQQLDAESDDEEAHVQAVMRKLSRSSGVAQQQRPEQHVERIGDDPEGHVVRQRPLPSDFLTNDKALQEEVRRVSRTLDRQPKPDPEALLKKALIKGTTGPDAPPLHQQLAPLRFANARRDSTSLRSANQPPGGENSSEDDDDNDPNAVWGGARVARRRKHSLRKSSTLAVNKSQGRIDDASQRGGRQPRGDSEQEALPPVALARQALSRKASESAKALLNGLQRQY